MPDPSDSEGRPRPMMPRGTLAILVIAQWACTSLWFAANAALPDLEAELGLGGEVGAVTSAVQIGFIAGTALIAAGGLADRFAAPRLFFASALVGAAANLVPVFAPSPSVLLGARFVVGVALAGIYPVGMKLAASWFEGGLGRALGFLVGALVLGTALPHLVGGVLDWRGTFIATSALAVAGGALVRVRVEVGPYTRSAPFDARAIVRLLGHRPYRRSALGYFGHMWELYTFWAFVPLLIARRGLPVGGAAFAVIGVGALGCVFGGLLAERIGSRRVAVGSMAASAVCCLLLPWAIDLPQPVFLAYLLFWGVAVVADSPQLSALSAKASPPALVGTALAVVTSVGFALTVASLAVAELMPPEQALVCLAIGPIIGALSLGGGRWGRSASAGEPPDEAGDEPERDDVPHDRDAWR